MKKIFNFFNRDNNSKQRKSKNATDETWERVIAFYNTCILESHPQLKLQILNLIDSIRANGFDKILSVSVSLYFLRVFKSSPEDCLFFEWPDGGMRVTKGKSVILECTQIEYSAELEIILNELANTEV